MSDTQETRQKVSIRECALIAAKAADEKKASDIMVQEVGNLISVTEYFVIATARNNRQVQAIIDEIEDKLRKEAGIKPLHREETRDGSWELLDYGGMVVHVFQPEARDYYRLEELWNNAPIVDLAAEAGLTDVSYSQRIADMMAAHGNAQKTAAKDLTEDAAEDITETDAKNATDAASTHAPDSLAPESAESVAPEA